MYLVLVMPGLIQLSKTPLKKLPEAIAHVQQAAPEADVELWVFDEHRIGREIHCPSGLGIQRATSNRGRAVSRPLALCLRLCPSSRTDAPSGSFYQLSIPSSLPWHCSTRAQVVRASKQMQIMLVLDRAGLHTS